MFRPKLRIVFVLFLTALPSPNRAGIADDFEFFESKIRPVLVERCFKCHSAQSEKIKGGLRLDTREGLLKGGDTGPAIVPGDPEKSLLIKAIRHTDKELQMPAKDKKLPDTVIGDLVKWVKADAPYPEEQASRKSVAPRSWAFNPIKNPSPPKVKNSAWPSTAIDRFILAEIEERGLQLASPADKRTLIRRATFDLIGLPPTPQEIADFLNDSTSEAFAKVVDRLLSSRHYGERWGRHWLDVVRYADTAGETADYPVPEAYLYRNYVIDSFNQDKPYDQFIREQIAGDILARQAPREKYAENITATGYLAISRRFGFDSENYHHLTIEDTIGTLGKSILGLTLGCARCHDHKYDPVSMTDYYALYGIFDSTRYAFPGSEQKQQYRALVPLLPVNESISKWHAFDAQVASLASSLEQSKRPVPATVLRSLDDMDGDFEMQAVAAGGSKGVLVPPWTYTGNIAVTKEAQSPFKNRYALGKVGVSVPSTTNGYFLVQALHPRRTRDTSRELHVNLDFRVATNSATVQGTHRFWIGAQPSLPAVEILISSTSVSIRSGDAIETLCRLQPNQWHNLQLSLNLSSNTVSGNISTPGDSATFISKQLPANWPGTIDYVAVDSRGGTESALPGLELDNLAVDETPIKPISTSLTTTTDGVSTVTLNDELQRLSGIDGDFELQTDDSPPASPWHPGPKSVVKISSAAQSPFFNVYPPGKLGLRLPNSSDYNGFGQTLTNTWKREKTEKLFASFDFRCVNNDKGGDGSWRFYLGHGAGGSAAVELSFNSKEFFRRSADAREAVCPLRLGQWYHVQLELNLKDKTYTGSIAKPDSPHEINPSPTTDTERAAIPRGERIGFQGEFASGWDGVVDYTFIDSYGHIEGVKPALDADNFAVRETSLPLLDSPAVQLADAEAASRHAKAAELRRQIVARQAELEDTKRELADLLDTGPVEMAYAVVEGTPHNARMQMRGDPDKPGLEVPRRFLQALGGEELPPAATGSGRLQLAQWLTSPQNPLTARVMANRIWQYHFGAGLVRTPNNFGKQGRQPTHPELLDYLATQFVESGWSIKAMHRLIMLSRVYQLSSENNSENFARDPDNEWLWNVSRRRLDAESLRDAILMVSGDLDLTVGGAHSFPSAEKRNYTQHGPFLAVYESKQRSVYLMVQRIKRHPYLALFDGADANESTAQRTVSTTPLQALFFMNDKFVHEQSAKFASRLINACTDDHQRVVLAYRLALGRAPSDDELHNAENYLRSYMDELKTTNVPSPEQLEMAWASYAGYFSAATNSAMSIEDNAMNNPICGCTRREMIRRLAGGSLLLSGILAELVSAEEGGRIAANPLAPKAPHFRPRAKRVIFLYMSGGVSHVDSFDPKPKLFKDHGKTVSINEFQGRPGEYSLLLKTPQWQFKPHGQCGTEVSDLFPHIAECVDDLCVIRSMKSDHTNHYEATLEMHTGSFTFARPSIGSWVSYGLGTINQNLPSFMVIAPQSPYAGEQVWDSNFLPAHYQGTRVVPGAVPIANLDRRAPSARLQELQLQALKSLNQQHLQSRAGDSQLEARIKSFETAFGMQTEAPEAFDFSKESDATLQLYGLERGSTKGFAWQCLAARRLAEHGVRFIELIDSGSSNNWDAHGDMLTHTPLAKNVDQAIAGLLKDLKARGMLDDTLVVWTTEFGRTPFNQAPDAKGREHHHWAFSSWLAGGGVKPGITYGTTDEYGINVAQNPVHVHDFHATILHLMGLDHERLTYRSSGRDFRLTDVSGNVVHPILA